MFIQGDKNFLKDILGLLSEIPARGFNGFVYPALVGCGNIARIPFSYAYMAGSYVVGKMEEKIPGFSTVTNATKYFAAESYSLLSKAASSVSENGYNVGEKAINFSYDKLKIAGETGLYYATEGVVGGINLGKIAFKKYITFTVHHTEDIINVGNDTINTLKENPKPLLLFCKAFHNAALGIVSYYSSYPFSVLFNAVAQPFVGISSYFFVDETAKHISKTAESIIYGQVSSYSASNYIVEKTIKYIYKTVEPMLKQVPSSANAKPVEKIMPSHHENPNFFASEVVIGGVINLVLNLVESVVLKRAYYEHNSAWNKFNIATSTILTKAIYDHVEEVGAQYLTGKNDAVHHD